MKLNIPRPGLQLKIIAWSFVPAAIILLGVGLFSFFFLQVAVERLMVESNRETTELMAEQIRGEFATLADQLKYVARTPDLLSDDVTAPRAALQRAASSLGNFDGGVVVLNRQGIVKAAEPARQVPSPEDWSDRPYVRQMVDSPGTILSDIHSDNALDTMVVSLAVPIMDRDGRFVGAVVGMLRVDSSGTSTLYRRLARFRAWPGGNALVSHGQLQSTYLVDHKGRVGFHTDVSQIGRDISSESAVQAVLAGAQGPIGSGEFAGRDVISYFSPISGTGWGFLVEQQRSEVLGFFQTYFQLQSLLFLLAIVVPVGIVAFGVRRITEPIRQVTAASRQITSGDLNQTINVRTGDELEELGNQFNRMSAQLRDSYTAFKEREERLALVIRATNDGIWDWDLKTNQVYFSPRWKDMLGYADGEIGNTFDDWRRLVHADDIQPALMRIEEYLQGKTSCCDLEYRLQHKDGSFRWILARGTALRDATGLAYRIVGSHTDVTERRQADDQIRRQNAYSAALHETALGVMGHLQVTDLLETTVERAVRLVNAADGFVYLVTPDRNALESIVETGPYRRYIGLRLNRGEGLSGKVWETGQPIAVEDYQAWSGRSASFDDTPIGPEVGAPLKSGAEVVGVIGLTRALGAPPFSREEFELTSRFAQLVSIALENARLHTSLQNELAERIRAEQALEHRLTLEKLISEISTQFINLAPDEIDVGIQRALRAIGEFARVDRSYVFLISSDGTMMDNTHEWCAPAIEPFIAKLKGLRIKPSAWVVGQLKQLRVVHVPSLDALPAEARAEKLLLEQQNIQSFINVPMVYRGALVGFLGFDSVLTKTWSDDTIALLRIVGETFANALEHKREQALEAGQRQFLELLATGGDFSAMLHTLIRIVEEQWPGMLGLILLLDKDGRHLHIGGSVSLPQDYVDSIEGLEIGPMVGSCGTACYRRERVIVEDILTDPRWDGLRNLAVQHRLRACWSEPVIDKNGQVVGTVAMYYRQPRAPSQDELSTIATAAHLVGIAIEHQHAQEALRQSEERFRAVFEGAPIGIHVTSWDADATDWSRHKIESNRALQQILGYAEDELAVMHLEAYSHPDDAPGERALYREMLEAKRERYQIEKRYLAKDGRVFWGRYSASMVRDLNDKPHLMIGMVENIDDQKKAEQALQTAYQTLERRVEERTRELAVLNSIAAVVSRSLDLKEIMRDALAKTIEFYGLDSGSAYELEEQSQTLVLIAHQGLSDDFAQKMSRLPLQVALAGQTPKGGRLMIWQVPQDYPEGELKQAMLHEGIQSIFAVPLMAKGTPVGAFAVRSKTPRVLTSEESALFAAVGQQVGVAVENARLYQQAQRIATTAERSRLARELHDSVTQSLYSVMLYAEAAVRSLASHEIPEASDYLKELRDTAQSALREMRLLIFELRPPALEKDGLVGALRTRLNAVEGRGGMQTELQVDDQQRADQLPLTLQEELYHITQEALNNVVRHAHAQSVTVRLQVGEKVLHLEIADNGIGFEPSQAEESSGLGLRGMRERVQRIGGMVQIESAEGKGTRVKVQVPGGFAAHDRTVGGGTP